jgi:hypothetical protein
MGNDWPNLFLRKRRFSFIEGAAGLFDQRPFSSHYRLSASPEAADYRALASDFIIVGNDMRAALNNFPRVSGASPRQ